MALIRDSKLFKQLEPLLKERENEFTEHKSVTVFCGTWNVNGKNPPESLEKWLCECEQAPDLYAIGFQEMDLTGQALLLGDTSKAGPWEELVLNNLNKIGNYSLILSRQLVGMFLCIYVKASHVNYISYASSASCGCGIMGKMGNKGAVGVRFQLYDSTFCFINSHLSAHTENVMRRNQDYNEICRRLLFEDPMDTTTIWRVFDHNLLFWLGDLNYRVDLDSRHIRKAIAKDDHVSLLASDQLHKERGKGNAFQGFQEAAINFKPTYKYDNGSDTYDSSEKQRAPAWCDRVLWYGDIVKKVIFYTRHELLSSDHRPVSGFFEINVKIILLEARQKVARDIVKDFDRTENQMIPHCSLSANRLDFGTVFMNHPKTQTITVTNETSIFNTSVIRYSLIAKPRSTSACKPWLKIFPDQGVLVPTESIEISFTVLVNSESAGPLNFNQETLSDIVILRLENGTDHYIEVFGDFQQTCIGNTLENLIRHVKPVRNNCPLSVNAPSLLAIPKELWKMIDYLYNNALDLENLFKEQGNDDEIKEFIEILDTGRDILEYKGSPYSVGGSLIFFLQSLREPVIPSSIYAKCSDACVSFGDSRKYLLSITTVHYNVFHYLIAFFREGVLAHSANNHLEVNDIVKIFSPVLLHSPTATAESIEGSEQFLTNYLLVPPDEVTPAAPKLI